MDIYSIIFEEPCRKIGCEHGVIRFSDKMGYENCDCDCGVVRTTIQVTEHEYYNLKDKLEELPF